MRIIQMKFIICVMFVCYHNTISSNKLLYGRDNNGIIIIQMGFETDKIDGRTILTNTGYLIIFINANASGDRQRLTLTNELGHLILHLGNMPVFW